MALDSCILPNPQVASTISASYFSSYRLLPTQSYPLCLYARCGGHLQQALRHCPLLAANWYRVVLDEAHVIRNVRTKTHKACESHHHAGVFSVYHFAASCCSNGSEYR
jgi:hypothetical protein